MNKIRFLTTAILLMFMLSAYGQTCNKALRFQGFAVSPDGSPLKSEAVTVRFTLYPKTGGGFIFEEVQDLTTDAYGTFYAAVGSGEADDFQRLNLTAPGVDYWLKIEVKKTTGGVYMLISDTEMTAVPYARYAANGVPVGTIMAFGGQLDKIPEGWLLCDGTEYDGEQTQYTQLYDAIGTAWGGTGGSVFNVPDLRGIFMRGQDRESDHDPDAATRVAIKTGANEGDNVGSFQTDYVGSHAHTFSGTTDTDGEHFHNISANHAYGMGSASSGDKILYNGDGGSTTRGTHHDGEHGHSFSGTTNNNTGNESRPNNVYVAYIIKY